MAAAISLGAHPIAFPARVFLVEEERPGADVVTSNGVLSSGELPGAPPDVRVGSARPGAAVSDIATSAVPMMIGIPRIDRIVLRALNRSSIGVN